MSKNIIKLNRGDSYEFSVCIPDLANSTQNYILTDKDVLYFALLYPHQRFEDAIIIKGYESTDVIKDSKNAGEILVKIEPKDTLCLAPGIYYYTVKLHKDCAYVEETDRYTEPKEVLTIIERTKFIINE